jgi:hypothetical protein
MNVKMIAAVATVAAAGAYARWAVQPVAAGFRAGKACARINDDTDRRVLIHALADLLTELEEHHGKKYRPLREPQAGEHAPNT